MVAQFQVWFKPFLPSQLAGPGDCQGVYGGQTTHCVESYATRLLLIRCLTMFWIGMYAKVKRDFWFKKLFFLEVVYTSIVVLCTLGMLADPTTLDAIAARSWSTPIQVLVTVI